MAEDLDLLKLEATARVASTVTTGAWACEHVRHMQHDLLDVDGEAFGSVSYAVVGDFIAACDPTTVLTLVALVHHLRAERDGYLLKLVQAAVDLARVKS